MEYTHLGRSGLSVSRLCLGTMNFGPLTPPRDAHVIMDRAQDLGINFFDTANTYGRRQSPPGQVADNDQSHAGWTEEIIGDWFALGGGRREKTVLATKLYGDMGEWPNQSKLPALHIRRACDESLRRLHTDYIDLYQFHHIDRGTPWEEIWQACEVLVQQGKILYVGSSNFAGWHIAQANEIARSRHFLGLVSEQSLYNLNARTVELEVIPACEAYGLGLIPYSPLAGGLLGGALRKANEGRRSSERTQRDIEQNRRKLEAYEGFCKQLGQQPADVALAWLLHQPVVTAPIIGPRTMTQLDGALQALEIRLSGEQMAELDSIFPGPGGPAPEAYAW